MHTYQHRIRELAPASNSRHIEAFMRLEHPTLDSLTAEAFRKEVVRCSLLVDEDPQRAERVSNSFGL